MSLHRDRVPLTTVRGSRVQQILAPVVAGAIAVLVGRFVPLISPLLLALIAGALVANSGWRESSLLDGHATATRLLLRVGVVLLGLRLPLQDIASIGVRGILVIAATVLTTYTFTRLVGARMRLDGRFVTLLATGFAICGAAAIAAVNDAVRARQRDVALAIALVTVFGSAMILALPWAAAGMGLSDTQAAIWAGASIHEVAQVVAAASLLGTSAIAVATTIKLGRVALLAPTYMLAVHGSTDARRSVPLVPWFVVGFALMVAVRSTGVLPPTALSIANVVTTTLLAAAMFGLGLGFRLRDLWPIPTQALILASVSTLIAAGSSLTLIAVLY